MTLDCTRSYSPKYVFKIIKTEYRTTKNIAILLKIIMFIIPSLGFLCLSYLIKASLMQALKIAEKSVD